MQRAAKHAARFVSVRSLPQPDHCTLRLPGDEGATVGTSQDKADEYAEATPPTVARTPKYIVLPRGIASVVMLKALEVAVVEVPNAVGDARLELVDHTGVYVTDAEPMPDPSVYVVTAFHDKVSACAGSDQTIPPSSIAIPRMMPFAFICASAYLSS